MFYFLFIMIYKTDVDSKNGRQRRYEKRRFYRSCKRSFYRSRLSQICWFKASKHQFIQQWHFFCGRYYWANSLEFHYIKLDVYWRIALKSFFVQRWYDSYIILGIISIIGPVRWKYITIRWNPFLRKCHY